MNTLNSLSVQRSCKNASGKGKLERMLELFAKGYRLNTFKAKELGDTCLHTTISSLQTKHGIHFSREWETLPGRFGPARVRRYWLDSDDLRKAREIVKKNTARAS